MKSEQVPLSLPMRRLVGFLCLAALACRPAEGSSNSEFLLRGVDIATDAASWEVDTSMASLSIQERIIDPAFGRIGAVGADAAGRLLVYDLTECRITLISSDRQTRGSFGRCGEGPGEFGSVVSVSFKFDTVLVINYEPARITWLTAEGRELRRLPLERLSGAINDVATIDDTTFAVTMAAISSSGKRLLALVDSRTGLSRQEALTMPKVVVENPSPRMEYLNICRAPAPRNSIFAIQQWLMQTVEMTADSLLVRSSHQAITDYDGSIAPTFPGRPIGNMRPRFRATDIACNDVGVVAWARTVLWSEVPPRDSASLVEIRSYEGKLIYRGSNPSGIHSLARVVAAWGNSVAFATNEDVPEIVVARINVH